MVRVNCDLCGSESYNPRFQIKVNKSSLRYYRYSQNIPYKAKMTGIFNIVECNKCKLLYTNPRFSTEELKIVYSSNKIIGGKWKNFPYLFNGNVPDEVQNLSIKRDPSINEWKFDIISSYSTQLGKKKKLLDIGCGDGAFVYDAICKGYDAYGLDLSPDRIKEGIKKFDLNDRISFGNIDEYIFNQKFDIITCWDVIEHVESPREFLKKIKTLATTNCKIFVLTMSINSITYRIFKKNWNYINPTQHLHYFSHNTMERMFNSSGIKLIGIEMDDSSNLITLNLFKRIIIGFINNLIFKIYSNNNFLVHFLKPFQKGISNKRMKKRLENLYPGKYVGRYHDNFVFIGKVNYEPVVM